MNRSHRFTSCKVAVAAALCVASIARADTDPAGFAFALEKDASFKQGPALLPGGQIAVMLGDPAQAGPYVSRTRFPAKFRMMPHTHPDARTYTVLSGTLMIGFGDKFEAAKLRSLPKGTVFTVPANVPHFNATGPQAALFQINSVGPTSSDYVDAADDPRKSR